MHYDDMIRDYGYDWDEDRRWDEEPKAVTALAEKRYQFDKIDHVTQGAYKFRDANGLFWVPKYAVAGMVHPNEEHPGYVIIDPYVDFSARYWNGKENITTSDPVPEMRESGKGYRKYEIQAPSNLQPLTKVKVLNICNVSGELYAVCEDGRVRSFDFDENEWIDLPAILK